MSGCTNANDTSNQDYIAKAYFYQRLAWAQSQTPAVALMPTRSCQCECRLDKPFSVLQIMANLNTAEDWRTFRLKALDRRSGAAVML